MNAKQILGIVLDLIEENIPVIGKPLANVLRWKGSWWQKSQGVIIIGLIAIPTGIFCKRLMNHFERKTTRKMFNTARTLMTSWVMTPLNGLK